MLSHLIADYSEVFVFYSLGYYSHSVCYCFGWASNRGMGNEIATIDDPLVKHVVGMHQKHLIGHEKNLDQLLGLTVPLD